MYSVNVETYFNNQYVFYYKTEQAANEVAKVILSQGLQLGLIFHPPGSIRGVIVKNLDSVS